MADKIEEVRDFLKIVGMPKAQQTDICCYFGNGWHKTRYVME